LETKELRSLNGQINRLKKAAKDNLGEGIWGLKKKEGEKFTHEEIVFLFARVFPVLGIDYIKEVRTEYPDCICVKEGIEIAIEFEPSLSSFKDHLRKDDLSKCQYVVCWKDDLGLYDPMREEIKKYRIQVIELNEFYEEVKGKIKGRKEPRVITQAMIDRLGENQIKVLKAFVVADRDLLTRDEIAEATGVKGKRLGGTLGGFIQLEKSLVDWIIRKRPDKTWEFNNKHKDKVIATLKKFKI